MSVRYSERLAGVGIGPSARGAEVICESAPTEMMIGLHKTELIGRRKAWRNLEAVEFATLKSVDWLNDRRLFETIVDVPLAASEAIYYGQLKESAMVD